AGQSVYVVEDGSIIPYGCQPPNKAVVEIKYQGPIRSKNESFSDDFFGGRLYYRPTVVSIDGHLIPRDAITKSKTRFVLVSPGLHEAVFENGRRTSFEAAESAVYGAPDEFGFENFGSPYMNQATSRYFLPSLVCSKRAT